MPDSDGDQADGGGVQQADAHGVFADPFGATARIEGHPSEEAGEAGARADLTIEQYEATLIQVNKKTKGNVNLTMFIKRSTARDFRIDGEKLSRKMERREQNEEEKESKRRKDEEPQFCVC